MKMKRQNHKNSSCRQIKLLLENRVAEKISDAEARVLESHCAECAACHREWHLWQTTLALTASLRSADVPESQRGWNDLQARLTTSAAKPHPAPRFALKTWSATGSVAAAVVCFALWRSAPLPPQVWGEPLPLPHSGEPQVSPQVGGEAVPVPSVSQNREGESKVTFSDLPEPRGREKTAPSNLGKQLVPSNTGEASIPPRLGGVGGHLAKNETTTFKRIPAETRPSPRLMTASFRTETPQAQPLAQTSKPMQTVRLGVDGEPPTTAHHDSPPAASTQQMADAPRYVMGSIGNSDASLTPETHSSSKEMQAW